MATVRRQIVATVQNGLLRPGADATYADGDDASWTHVDWPSITHCVEVLGRRVNTVDTGGEDKPALIYIHGLGCNWQN